MPDARARKAIDHLHPEPLRRLRRLLQFLRRPLTHPFRIAIAINIVRQNRLVPRINVVAHRLSHKVRRNRVTLQPRFRQLRPPRIAVRLVGLRHLEVIAPAGEFHAIVAEGFRLLQHGFNRQIGPLAGEKCDRSGHGMTAVEWIQLAAGSDSALLPVPPPRS